MGGDPPRLPTDLRYDGRPRLEDTRDGEADNHHNLGALGAAFNRCAAERQLETPREMGLNAMRMSHHSPAPGLLESADAMGFLVFDEVFDSWERRKTPLDLPLILPDWHDPDLRAMIRCDRNDASIILRGVGNEGDEQYTGEAGAQIAREEDPTRLVSSAMNWASIVGKLPIGKRPLSFVPRLLAKAQRQSSS